MAQLRKEDSNVLRVLLDGRANPRHIQNETGLDKAETYTSLRRLSRLGYVTKIARGLYEITDEGRAALESE